MAREVKLPRPDSWLVLASAALVVLALSALLFRVGADAQWLAALGRVIGARHAVPAGVPFAAAATQHWANAVVGGELIFAGLENLLGDGGLMLAQLLAVAVAVAAITWDARAARANRLGIAAALLLAGVGALPSLAIARGQLFSLALFPVLAALLRSETRHPSRRIWWVVALIAVWANLHGAVLLGYGVLLVYLGLERARRAPLTTLGVAAAGLLALLATPAGLRTFDYYRGVLSNVAAQRGVGMWGRLSLSAPLDLILILCALVLVHRAWRARPPRWELVTIAILAVLTVQAGRDGVWLLLFAAVPAARRLAPARVLPALAPVAAALSVLGLGFAVARGPVASGAGPALVSSALTWAHGSPILADGTLDEQVALAGGRIWAGNPIDAFSHRVQSEYLDWVAGVPAGVRAVAPEVSVVLVTRGSPTQALMARLPAFTAAGGDRAAVLYRRVS